MHIIYITIVPGIIATILLPDDCCTAIAFLLCVLFLEVLLFIGNAGMLECQECQNAEIMRSIKLRQVRGCLIEYQNPLY